MSLLYETHIKAQLGVARHELKLLYEQERWIDQDYIDQHCEKIRQQQIVIDGLNKELGTNK